MEIPNYKEEALSEVRETRLLLSRVDEWLYDEVTPYLGQRVLEVGCGLGNLLRHLNDRELFVGIDPDPATIERVRVDYAGQPNVRLYPLNICDPEILKFKTYGFDTIVSLNVFEHIADDECALRNVRELLESGGNLVLIVPAHSWLYGSIDSAIGHYRRYNKQLMNNKLRQAGFETIIMQKYLNALGALGWFVNGKVLRRQTPPSNQLRLFNLLVPFLRGVEQVVSLPVGISLLAVAQ